MFKEMTTIMAEGAAKGRGENKMQYQARRVYFKMSLWYVTV